MEAQRLTAKKAMTFDAFTTHLFFLTKNAWGEDWGVFTELAPTSTDAKEAKFPQIVYHLKEMRPGLVGKETREIKPRFRETKQVDGQQVIVRSQIMDCVVGFYIYGTSNADTEKIAMNFMDLLATFKPYLMENGLKEMFFQTLSVVPESSLTKERTSTRYLEYLVRLEYHQEIQSETIREVILKTQTDIEAFNEITIKKS